jgi:ArsR family transcriptional regulator
LRILNLLAVGELCGCDIQYVLEVSQSAVSRHLNYLKRAGLVSDRRDGYRVFYRLIEEDGRSSALFLDYLRRALQQDKAFAADLKALKAAIRQGACSISEASAGPQPRKPASRRARSVPTHAPDHRL